MPWRQVPMKDAEHCDKPRGAVNRRYIRGFPNGETRYREPIASPVEYIDWLRGTLGTETSKYQEEKRSFPK
jgi:hypothetical protein